MSPSLPSPLPVVDRTLLGSALHLVPASDRADWLRCWHAELWHRHHPRCGVAHSAADLYPGLLQDALWLRTESWRRAFGGTAILCLGTLAAAVLVTLLPLLAYCGDLRGTVLFLVAESPRFLIEAILTTIVGFAIASHVTEHSTPHTHRFRVRAHSFLISKVILVQILAYLLSVELTEPFHSAHAFSVEIIQPQLCTVLALLALRWSFQDQDTRCRECLRSLSAPLRVGRPSWNFLDSNGTQLTCSVGHGLLSIPEIETSWRQSSEWIAR